MSFKEGEVGVSGRSERAERYSFEQEEYKQRDHQRATPPVPEAEAAVTYSYFQTTSVIYVSIVPAIDITGNTIIATNIRASIYNTATITPTFLRRASRRYKGASKPRGVSNRNAGLKWLKAHASEGVIYFADDDNTYDYRIFQEIRVTRQVSMFPVGLVTRLGVSSPIVAEGKVIGFYDGWIAGRRFPVDMAGFAVNLKFYLERNAPLMPYSVGFEEDGFLKALNFSPGDIEPLADNCTKIMVWHTRTVKSLPAVKMPDSDKVLKTNLRRLRSQMVFQMPFGVS
ncbi:galactosylgalactosylxylosylprotein 3-beta-glucuronosyltransferase P-like [Penaeus chinensis]|uniref:galactosylgalactosylxylosylprotein 3-beta-glucuronosyltransferase P-like n=1 Tax=Penaeus chinensis TaxID=139456 RepID=UPI001FB708AB|nr:galactosylgalactosylxylosylprotein 3-beta-glucuronosyltransferase P-like [Penaeus chinensis]